ncbi:sigma-70 family RNA polymerase sigma factor [Roseiconus lacunae]|uniref:Sigma-70 family RNA polymerase sigma factor n=1 Tax=Roseiconus lacunae TaxID=2605694 RepID=A0ABT7PG85_9BACT|nr:sigma-70 family RNA polymerase sigma factor [Roseiconus lacunae]MCD0460554.1 sigma-70 family RNA polymerase sigma factor [Roseiconus lacunae]MDM4015398.1 sigma-70 family RNA polymerase sigma factor [Roseiconus lacunae]
MAISSTEQIESAIEQARNQGGDALGCLLQSYRNYMYLLAAAQLGKQLGQRVSASDVVQEVMLAAQRDFEKFRGRSAGELSAWLKIILSRALVREFERHVEAGKRDVRREVSLDAIAAGLESSCTLAASILPGRTPDPAEILIADEESRRVADLVASLPEHYRTVVMLKNFVGLETEQIAMQMGRSPQAIRLLWMRALRALKSHYEAEFNDA